MKQLRFGLEDLKSNLLATDNYIQKYLSFWIQHAINETLDFCLIGQDMHSKLKQYE